MYHKNYLVQRIFSHNLTSKQPNKKPAYATHAGFLRFIGRLSYYLQTHSVFRSMVLSSSKKTTSLPSNSPKGT